jgi:hypothetical protein
VVKKAGCGRHPAGCSGGMGGAGMTRPGSRPRSPGPHRSGGNEAGKQVLEARELPPSRKGSSRSGRSHARCVTHQQTHLRLGVCCTASGRWLRQSQQFESPQQDAADRATPRACAVPTPTRSKGSKLELHFRAPKLEARSPLLWR